MQILMRARRPFRHGGEQLRAGQTFRTSAVQAAALQYQQQATFASPDTRSRAPLAASSTPRKSPRTYKRRDLQAEP